MLTVAGVLLIKNNSVLWFFCFCFLYTGNSFFQSSVLHLRHWLTSATED